jgi:ubiquinone/menaquinone biosynthesis C-methylase UbiE
MTARLDPAEAETRIIHHLIDFAGKDVLDVGCGDGRMTWRFVEQTHSVLGLDRLAASIEQARLDTPAHLRSKVTFQVADITTAQLPAAVLDVAALSWSLC